MEIISEIHVTLVLMLFIKLSKTSPPCNWNQITRINGSKTLCWDCPNCPTGYGLSPQCSSYVTTDVPIRCSKCKDGVAFSDVNDISSCKPCSICGPNEYTIRQCNATHNAICGKCKPGFYREITFDCWPCTKCCPDSTVDDIEPKCLNQGLPAKHSCRLNFRTKSCSKRARSSTVKSRPSTTKSYTKSSILDRTTLDTPSSIVINHTVVILQHRYQATSDRLWMGVGIGSSVILFVGFLIAILCKVRRRYNYPQSSSITSAKWGFSQLNGHELGTGV